MTIESAKRLANKMIEAREKATDGVWQVEKIGDGQYDAEQIIVHDGKTGFGDDIICDLDPDKPGAKNNASFITHAANNAKPLAELTLRLVKALEESKRVLLEISQYEYAVGENTYFTEEAKDAKAALAELDAILNPRSEGV
jgi:hypothetical protein